MPPSHPRPDDLTALSAALSATAEHSVTAGEELLGHMVTVGDHATQVALEDVVDEAVDALRELSATCRELVLSLSPDVGPARTDAPSAATAARQHR